MQKILFNLHNHSYFCDGSSAPEEYIQEALKKGFHTIGFSSHAPVPFQNKFAIKNEKSLLEYRDEINRLKAKYKNQINVFLALEVDYIPGITSSFCYFKNLAHLDYTIGGVHLVKASDSSGLWFIDGPRQETYDEGLQKIFGGDARKGVTTYWEQIRQMIESENPDIVAHLDKIKMHNRNRFFTEDESWYVDELDRTLELLAKKNTIVEVNTRGVYKGRSDELFPGNKALQKIYKLGIPVTLNSDAHKPCELDGYFSEARKIMKAIGFRKLKLFTSKGWEDVSI